MATFQNATDSIVEAFHSNAKGAARVAYRPSATWLPTRSIAKLLSGESAAVLADTFAPHLTSSAAAAPLKLGPPVPVSQSAASRLLEGTWKPPPRAASFALRTQCRDPRLTPRDFAVAAQSRSTPRPEAKIARFGEPLRGDAASRSGLSSGAGYASASRGQHLRSGQSSARGETPSTVDGGSMTHATTPSWRSRTVFVPTHVGSAEGSEFGRTVGAENAKRRLPQLPLEARWASVELRPGGSASELRRLDGIDSAVHEANAMLVESFLNVKRSPLPPESEVSESRASGSAYAPRSRFCGSTAASGDVASVARGRCCASIAASCGFAVADSASASVFGENQPLGC
mmetsp:Transcript_6254/g.15538  ORF Transcript_6254/g.15538 Transcript_6254/m.15538 type:complete len:344 (-) Transcript_6254:154-1185(-)|eukprot:CAMPEP_0117462772 /NCGR_PEP_ID=MMETSP0784-20121206/3229_1 /TAXON_ID=39447 /ORGANISM="" /LENGTH=343 /DNA_ID=CAMNT_0005256553 /DNA_START=38 /DNA_END=1069 /DNA_ORIENTATION=+